MLYKTSDTGATLIVSSVPPLERCYQVWEKMMISLEVPKGSLGSDRWQLPLGVPSEVVMIEKSLVRGFLLPDRVGSRVYDALEEAELYREGIDANGLFPAGVREEKLTPQFPFENTTGLEAMPRQFRQGTSPEDYLNFPIAIGRSLLRS